MYKLKQCLLGFMIAISITNTYANSKYITIVDIYGTKSITADKLQTEYASEFQIIADAMMSPHTLDAKVPDALGTAYMKIIEGIKAKNKFAYVTLTPVIYPNETHKAYITVDVVEEKQRSRLNVFLQQPSNQFHDPDGLIHAWNKYSNEQFNHFLKTRQLMTPTTCPVFHCVFGFEGKYKKYQTLFDTKVAKNKQTLISMLSDDKDEDHRASAAFLLAHIKDGNELIKVLTPSIRDSNSDVRNNAVRVLAATLEKLKTADFPVSEAVAALNFPNDTDRNKALYLLLALAQQPRYASYITSHAGDLLLANLAMSQPNLHDVAYHVLQKISGKNYGERDYVSWKSWLKNKNK
jgi:hypothetical protein